MDVLNYALGFDNPFDKFNAGVERGLGVKANNEAQLQAIANNKRAQETHQSGLATAALGRQQTQQQIEIARENQGYEARKRALELKRLENDEIARRNFFAGKEWWEGTEYDPRNSAGATQSAGGSAPATGTPSIGSNEPIANVGQTYREGVTLDEILNDPNYKLLTPGERYVIGAKYRNEPFEATLEPSMKLQAQKTGVMLYPLLDAVASGNYAAVEEMKNSSNELLKGFAEMFGDGATPEGREKDMHEVDGMINQLYASGALNDKAAAKLFDRLKATDKAQEPLDTKQKADLTKDLRKEYTAVVTVYNKLHDEYNKLILALNDPNSGVGDITAIFTYMKTLDPASVVREGEFNLAASSQGVWSQILTYIKKAESGDRLDDTARNAMAGLGYQFTQLGYDNTKSITAPILEQAKEHDIATNTFEVAFNAPAAPKVISKDGTGKPTGDASNSATENTDQNTTAQNRGGASNNTPLGYSLTDAELGALVSPDFPGVESKRDLYALPDGLTWYDDPNENRWYPAVDITGWTDEQIDTLPKGVRVVATFEDGSIYAGVVE